MGTVTSQRKSIVDVEQLKRSGKVEKERRRERQGVSHLFLPQCDESLEEDSEVKEDRPGV